MKTRRFAKRVCPGFTLLEVLSTVLIIAVLAAVAIPLYNNSRADAEDKVCTSHVAAIANAEAKYRFEKGSFTTTGANLIGYGLLEFPKCPKTNTSYTLTAVGTTGVTIACAGTGAHTGTNNSKTVNVP